MYVTALVDFYDRLKEVDRKAGEEFVVTKERFDEVNAVGYANIGGPILEEKAVSKPVAKTQKQTPESRAKKAPAKRRAKKAVGD